MIHHIEKLGPELRIESVRDPLDVVVLEHGKIEVNPGPMSVFRPRFPRIWKHYIENNHVEVAGPRHLQSTDTVKGQADEVVLFLQTRFQHLCHLPFVFDNQYPHKNL